MNALMVAASLGGPEGIKCILKKLASFVNATDGNGRSALHFACLAGKDENVKILIKIPTIKKDLRTIGGNTPLMYAVQSCDV